MKKINKLGILILLLTLVTTGIGCKGGSKEAQQSFSKVKLTYWRVFDEEDALLPIFEEYKKVHPNVSFEYRKLRFEEYREELLNAMAEDRGPDIFTIHNTWVGEYIPKLSIAPPQVNLPFRFVKGSIKKETVVEVRTLPGVTVSYILKNFVDQVAYDVVWTEKKSGEDKVFGVPLSLDTLVLFFNRDLLNNAGIPESPRTWSDFQTAVKKIVRLDTEGNIALAGAGIGTSQNVERSSDILSLLMMQNGAVMQTEDRSILFHEMPKDLREKRVVPPGVEALRFYSDFSSDHKEVYTWNKEMPNSLDAFISGKSAFFFGYSYHLPVIQQRAPKLNLGIAKAPQIAGNKEVNFANYFVEVVSKKSPNSKWAWDFLKFASDPAVVKLYLDKAKKPTAVRSLVLEQTQNVELEAFASQVLTAKSWYKGYDALAAEDILEELIDVTNEGQVKIRDAVNSASSRVQQTTYSRKQDL